jgi:hypothetical protein
MKLKLSCGLEFRVIVIAQSSTRSAVKVTSRRPLTEPEMREAHLMIAERIGARPDSPGLIAEQDPAKLNAIALAFVSYGMERN